MRLFSPISDAEHRRLRYSVRILGPLLFKVRALLWHCVRPQQPREISLSHVNTSSEPTAGLSSGKVTSRQGEACLRGDAAPDGGRALTTACLPSNREKKDA